VLHIVHILLTRKTRTTSQSCQSRNRYLLTMLSTRCATEFATPTNMVVGFRGCFILSWAGLISYYMNENTVELVLASQRGVTLLEAPRWGLQQRLE
jgi:hypothetical protein